MATISTETPAKTGMTEDRYDTFLKAANSRPISTAMDLDSDFRGFLRDALVGPFIRLGIVKAHQTSNTPEDLRMAEERIKGSSAFTRRGFLNTDVLLDVGGLLVLFGAAPIIPIALLMPSALLTGGGALSIALGGIFGGLSLVAWSEWAEHRLGGDLRLLRKYRPHAEKSRDKASSAKPDVTLGHSSKPGVTADHVLGLEKADSLGMPDNATATQNQREWRANAGQTTGAGKHPSKALKVGKVMLKGLIEVLAFATESLFMAPVLFLQCDHSGHHPRYPLPRRIRPWGEAADDYMDNPPLEPVVKGLEKKLHLGRPLLPFYRPC